MNKYRFKKGPFSKDFAPSKQKWLQQNDSSHKSDILRIYVEKHAEPNKQVVLE